MVVIFTVKGIRGANISKGIFQSNQSENINKIKIWKESDGW